MCRAGRGSQAGPGRHVSGWAGSAPQAACGLCSNGDARFEAGRVTLVEPSKVLKLSAPVFVAPGASTSSKPPSGTARTTVFVGPVVSGTVSDEEALTTSLLPRPRIMLGDDDTAAAGDCRKTPVGRKASELKASVSIDAM